MAGRLRWIDRCVRAGGGGGSTPWRKRPSSLFCSRLSSVAGGPDSRWTRRGDGRGETGGSDAGRGRDDRRGGAGTRGPVLRTHALNKLPTVGSPEDILARALKVSERATLSVQTKRGKSFTEVHRLTHTKRVETLRTLLTAKVTDNLQLFPPQKQLHPYESALVDLTLSRLKIRGGYQDVLDNLRTLVKKINAQGEMLAASVRKAQSLTEADQRKENAFTVLEQMYQKHLPLLEQLRVLTRSLRQLQIADVSLPTVLVSGAPNVGKSSLVRRFSTGVPEVCSYPFTTKSIVMGHFVENGTIYQMADTPGLMNREEETRNEIEQLSVAALQHLDAVIVFVVDLTEHCGTSVEDQLGLRTRIRERFFRQQSGMKQAWIDVLSKADLRAEFRKEDQYVQIVRDPLCVSVVSNLGLKALRTRFIEQLQREDGPVGEQISSTTSVGSAGSS